MSRAVSSIVAVVLILIFLVAGVATGYVIRSGGTTVTSTTTVGGGQGATTIVQTITTTVGGGTSVTHDSTSFAVAEAQISGSPWFTSMLISQNEGYFKSWVPNAQLVQLSGGSGQAVQELAAGTVQMAVAGPDTVAKAIATGAPIKIVANYDENLLTWSMVVLSNSSYHTISDLKGKNLGISSPGSLGDLFMQQMLKPVGLQENVNYTVTALHSIQGLIAGLTSGSVAAFTWAYWGQLTPLFDQGEIRTIGNYTAAWPYNIVAARTDFIQQHPGAITAFLNALYQGEMYFWTNETNSVHLLNQTFGLSEQDAQAFFTSGALRYAIDGALFIPQLQYMLDTLHSIGIISVQLQANDIVATGFAPVFNVPVQ